MDRWERLRLFAIAAFHPRKAVAEGLYDGRVIGAIGLNVCISIPSVYFLPMAIYRSDLSMSVPAVIGIVYGVILGFLLQNWLFPKILLRRLCPPIPQKQLTKRERRERRNLPQTTIRMCRQLVLFCSVFHMIVTLPIRICLMFASVPGYVDSIVTYIVYPLIGLYWLYMAVWPHYFGSKEKAVKKILAYEALCLFQALAIIIVPILAIGLGMFALA